MSYYQKKLKHEYSLFLKKQPLKKVYAAVSINGKFAVLTCNAGNFKYCLSGGGVEKGETNQIAIVREIGEELNMNVEIVKSLGTIHYTADKEYKGKKFTSNYEAEIFLTKFISYGKNTKLGIDGEFDNSINVAIISKEEMLNNVAEFVKFDLTLD